jgi:integrase
VQCGLFAVLPAYLRLPFAIGYFTGMRESEILGLKWNQVDFLSGAIRLQAGETKNDEGREVPITPQLHALLEEQYAKRQPECEAVWARDLEGEDCKSS